VILNVSESLGKTVSRNIPEEKSSAAFEEWQLKIMANNFPLRVCEMAIGVLAKKIANCMQSIQT
jgi:hypothetical protein